MDKYEENLLRLNHRIRDLIAQVDRLDTKNRKLHNENTVLVEDVARFRAQWAQAEEARLQCKSVVEKELERSQQQFEAHQLLKRRYNDLIKEYVAQNHKLKALEANAATVRHSRIKRNRVPVEIIGKISDIGKPTAFEERMTTLENRCSALEKELAKAYTIIDDLEFELETIDHLEDLNDQLERQVRDLKVELELQRRSSLTSDHLALMTSPEPHIQITTGADLSGTKQTSAPPESQKFGEFTKPTSGALSFDQNTNIGTISEMLPALQLTEEQREPRQPPVD